MATTLSSLLNRGRTLKFFIPAAAITGALTIGAPSAQALQTGALAFSNGNGDFAHLVDVDDPTNSFSVVFNTPGPGTVVVNNANGLFVPPFAATPPSIVDNNVAAVTATFNWLAAGPNPGSAIYRLQADTAFTFSNGVSVGIFGGIPGAIGTGGVDFLVNQGATAVQVEVTQFLPPDQTSFVTGLPGGPVFVTAGAFTFNDNFAIEGGGSYSAQVSVAREVNEVPGPLSILGAGAAFGYSRRLRKRVKAGVSA